MTEEQYAKWIDEDYNRTGDNVKYVYCGYPYVAVFETSNGSPWNEYTDWMTALHEMKAWCRANCTDSWREDFHRVWKDFNGEWECNEISGIDVLFFAFKNEKDYTWFMLRWR